MASVGIVESVSPHGLKVIIREDLSQCASCAIKSICHPMPGQTACNTVIDIPLSVTHDFHAGDEVTLHCTDRRHITAILLSLAFPCLMLVGTVLLTIASGINEGTAACAGLGVTIVYYALLYAFRNKLRAFFNKMKICHR